MSAKSINTRIAHLLIRHAGRLTKLASHAQMASLYALGIGSAAYDPRVNGERRLIEQLVGREAVTVFDAGANRGAYAELVLNVLGSRANIHCFEPAPDTFTLLEERLGDRATLHRCALGAEAGQELLHTDEALSVSASLRPRRGMEVTTTTPVRVETVETICDRERIERIDLLKLDVEGAELDALRGAQALIDDRRIGLVQFEFGRTSLDARAYMRDFYDLLGATHQLFRVTPHELAPLGEYRLALEIFESVTNYAAVPNGF